MVIFKKNSDLHLTITSALENLQKVERFTEKIADRMKFKEAEKDSLAIAVTEVVSNAIIHGNKKDKKKKVHIRYHLTNKALTIYVQDEGEGFNIDNISNPLEPENLLKESGRGIFIVRALMDDVQFDFSGKGTLVKLVKRKTEEKELS